MKTSQPDASRTNATAAHGKAKKPWSAPRLTKLTPGTPAHDRARAALAAKLKQVVR